MIEFERRKPRAPLIDIMTMTIPRIRRKKGGSEVTTIGVAAPSYARRAIPNNPKPKKYRLVNSAITVLCQQETKIWSYLSKKVQKAK